MYVLGGESSDELVKYGQAFMIDLSVSWKTSAPIYKKLPDGPVSFVAPSTMSSDGKDWVAIVGNTCYAYNILSATWSPILTDNAIGRTVPGSKAATDPETGFMYFPDAARGVNGSSLMMKLDLRTKSFEKIPMFPGSGFAVAWSAVAKSLFYFGQSGFQAYSPSKGWTILTTKGAIPTPRNGHCLVSADGGRKLILTAGYSTFVSRSLSDIYILDVATLTWTAGPSLPPSQGRDSAACGVSNNQLIVWGGAYNDPATQSLASAVPLIFDLKVNNWTSSYNAPPQPKPTGTPSTLPQTSIGLPSSTPTLDPSTPGNNNGSPTVIILAAVIGVLVVALVAGGLVYCFRSKRAKDSNDKSDSSLDHSSTTHKEALSGTGYSGDLGYVPPPSCGIPYPLPPAPAKVDSWTAHSPQSVEHNPGAVVYKQGVGNTPVHVRQDPGMMGRPQEGVYGMQEYSRHPQFAPGHFEGQGYNSGEMYELENGSQQTFINRRGPGFDDTIKVRYESRPVNLP